MKSLMRMVSSLVVGMLITHSAFGAQQNIPVDRTITRINTYSTYAVVYVSPTFQDQTGCSSNPNQQYVVIDWGTVSGNKNMYGAMLAAQALGQPVGFGINLCFLGTIPMVYRVDLGS